jgi:hypothetical protein
MGDIWVGPKSPGTVVNGGVPEYATERFALIAAVAILGLVVTATTLAAASTAAAPLVSFTRRLVTAVSRD